MGAFAPFDNASLTFKVYTTFGTDLRTGNVQAETEDQVYTANLQLRAPTTDDKPGTNENDFICQGKLLSPREFTSKVKVGAVATCTVNGMTGTFRVTGLGSNTLTFARKALHQDFTGVFEQTGNVG